VVLGDAANISIQQLTSEPFDSQSGNEGKVGKLCAFVDLLTLVQIMRLFRKGSSIIEKPLEIQYAYFIESLSLFAALSFYDS
jgi:hypothetical protein